MAGYFDREPEPQVKRSCFRGGHAPIDFGGGGQTVRVYYRGEWLSWGQWLYRRDVKSDGPVEPMPTPAWAKGKAGLEKKQRPRRKVHANRNSRNPWTEETPAEAKPAKPRKKKHPPANGSGDLFTDYPD